MNTDQCRLSDLLRDIKFTMFTTVAQDGSLHSRPMAAVESEADGALWFFTTRASGKVFDIERDPRVNLTYVDLEKNRFISVSGQASLIEDSQRAAQLWSPLYRAWFPKGLEDPELVLLRVNVQSAEVWDSPASTLEHLSLSKFSGTDSMSIRGHELSRCL